ncbi:ATP-binding protein, partial [Basilea psittacipulmonis]|uniref:ATP-binding protein n=1 Tax=Basilea psittacipulmonis TaxID=1472345 RepID=UPI000571C9E5
MTIRKFFSTLANSPHLQLGVFTRAFLFIGTVIIVSMTVWLIIFFSAQETPKAKTLAHRNATILNIIYDAFTINHAIHQQDLINAINQSHNIVILPRLPSDQVVEHNAVNFWHIYQTELKQQALTKHTKAYAAVNGINGLWLSFSVHDKDYWLMIPDNSSHDSMRFQWLGWGIVALILTINGAAISVRFVNNPLSRLSRLAQQLARHEKPDPLPTNEGPYEIRELNQTFNKMAQELRQSEEDREIMLAGISHDIRTPLSRIRLEVEMGPLSEKSKEGIEQDMSQIEHCIDQLIDYARTIQKSNPSVIDLSATLHEIGQREQVHCANRNATLTLAIAPNLHAHILEINLQRAINNLIENALRYGQNPHTHTTDITLKAFQFNHKTVRIEISDTGKGIPDDQIERLLRPFSRGEVARSNTTGTGLGLSIVERQISQSQGSFSIFNHAPHGLTARIDLVSA